MRKRTFDFALAAIAPHPHLRRQALRAAQQAEIEIAARRLWDHDIWTLTPPAQRLFIFCRPDGARIVITDFNNLPNTHRGG